MSPERTILRGAFCSRGGIAALAAVAAVLAGCQPGEKADDSQACVAPASWFPQSQTPKPDPSPPDGFQKPCDFHKWAWQSFLWLTQSVDGKLRFETFPTAQDAIESKDAPSAQELMRLAVRSQKTDHPQQPLAEVHQAGELGLLVDQNGRAVFYSQHLNQLMLDEIVSKHWNDPTVLNEIPPDTKFQTGDVELKASWMIVGDGLDISKFFVRSALIDKLVNEDGSISVDKGAPLEAKVALVGLHIVGWVKGHPEAIWATFEQNDNAPDFATRQSPSEPVSDRDWTFYKAHTMALDCNQPNSSDLVLEESTQTLKPITQVCREYPYGMVAGSQDQNDQQNLEAIKSLNNSVWSQLAPANLWRNYFEVGAVWTNGNLQPNNDQQANLIGSTKLSNAVLETFTQQVQSENNCFSCHNTLMFNPSDPNIRPLQGTNINLSHIISTAYLDNQN